MKPLTAADVAPAPRDPAEVARVIELGERLRAEERAVIDATDRLKAALAQYNQTAAVDLPKAMEEAGVSHIHGELLRLRDGTPLSRQEKLIGGKLSTPKGLAWVEEHGARSIIDTTITVTFDREHADDAREIHQLLRDHRLANGYRSLEFDVSVNAQTIAAFARDLQRQGKLVPLDDLNVRRQVRALLGKRAPKSVNLTGLER